jgi:hypothetical protein
MMGPKTLIPNIEVVVREAAALRRQDPVIRVLRRILRDRTPKRRSLLHALEDEVHTKEVLPLHRPLPAPNVLFLAHPFLGPLDRELVVAREGLHPALIIAGPLREHLLGDRRHSDHLAEEVHHLLGSRQPAKVAVDDDPVEAVIYEYQQPAEQLGKDFHRSSPPMISTDSRIMEQTTGGLNISNMFG